MEDFDYEPELNITPLVDIMLVLLAILMVTTPAVTYKEDINLPQGSKSKKVDNASMLVVRMDKDKKIYINNSIYNFDTFADNINLSSYDRKQQVYIRADKNIQYGDVVLLLKILEETGFSKVALITS